MIAIRIHKSLQLPDDKYYLASCPPPPRPTQYRQENANLTNLELEECTAWKVPWLVSLCICLAILLLIMLIVNIFMCSSLTCRCVKTDVEEKSDSSIEDYDPYRFDYSVPPSHYGSRMSLNKSGYNDGTIKSHRSYNNQRNVDIDYSDDGDYDPNKYPISTISRPHSQPYANHPRFARD